LKDSNGNKATIVLILFRNL